jgi:hypothetical protein
MMTRLPTAILTLSLLTIASPALGYTTYTTLSQGVQTPCSCELEQPRKLRWGSPNLPYWIQTAPLADPISAEQAIHQSIGAWDNIEGCGAPGFTFGGVLADPTFEGQVPRIGYDQEHPELNTNLITWFSSPGSWSNGPGVLALTRLTYHPCTGEIFDADITMNAVDFAHGTTIQPIDGIMDVQNTVTHEMGHFLGLDHSSSPDATMFPTAPNAEINKRSLEADDVDGLCCLYGENTPILLPGGTCESALGSGQETPEPSTQCPEHTLPQFFAGTWTCSALACSQGWIPAWNGLVFSCVPGECSASGNPSGGGCRTSNRSAPSLLTHALLLLIPAAMRRRSRVS